MPVLIITIGLPGCGKTTRARAWVAEDPVRRHRVNRDDIRAMLHGGRLGTREQEQAVTAVVEAAVANLLGQDLDVVCDNTSLRPWDYQSLLDVAARCGAQVEVWDMRDVPVDVCIARDAQRTGPDRVGEQVIRDLHTRYVAQRR